MQSSIASIRFCDSMGTKTINSDTKLISSWLRYTETAVVSAKKVVVVGFGSGEHVRTLQNAYPHLEILVVDPRRELFDSHQSGVSSTIQYISSLEGVKNLKYILAESNFLIPILEYRPCWYPYKVFFDWATYELKASASPQEWKDTPAEFILESLFL